jgi:Flp pilus assembly protein CpaB
VALLSLVTLVSVRSAFGASMAGTARYGALVDVPVVVEPVAAGDEVPAGAVVVEPRPAATVPEDEAATAWADRTALVDLVPGEVLVRSRLAPDGRRGAGALLPSGFRALAVPSGPAGRPPLAVGYRVDVLVTLVEGDSVVVAAGALVLHLDLDADTVTVAVPAGEAPALASAVTAGAVTLALTSP